MTHIPYANAVGNLMYEMMCMRLELSQAVSIVSRYMHDPAGSLGGSKVDSTYIKSTIDVDSVFEKDSTGKQECIRYVDSDYARNLDKLRSTMGYVFILTQARMSWNSILRSIIA